RSAGNAVRDRPGAARARDDGQSLFDPIAQLPARAEKMVTARTKIEIRDLRVRHGDKVVLDGVSLDVLEGEILAVIGPAGAGKTTLLQCINRMTDMMPRVRVEGTIRID